jgi:hypothetical protein
MLLIHAYWFPQINLVQRLCLPYLVHMFSIFLCVVFDCRQLIGLFMFGSFS